MLTEIYIEALLVDEELADQVWESWNARQITGELAAWAWCILALSEIEARSSPETRAETNVNTAHWTSETPIDPGWYWYRAKSHRAVMLRIDDHGLVDSHGEFNGTQATKLVGDWYTPKIKPPL